MPSPFPGMDPFLEQPSVFPDFHDALIAELRTALNQQLPGLYYAGIGTRVWIETSERTIGPDVQILRPDWRPDVAETNRPEQSRTAVLDEVDVVPVTIEIEHDETRESFLEIYASPGGERLVTHIELLSLSNKLAGSKGNDLYLRKQREIMDAQVHLVEIDLLRGGEHTTAPPRWRIERKAGTFHYHVSLHRFDKSLDCVVYPIPLPARLPKLPIPLLPGDGEVIIDLQAAVDRCYDTGLYARRVEYHLDRLTPPLTPEYQEWAANILARKAGGQPA